MPQVVTSEQGARGRSVFSISDLLFPAPWSPHQQLWQHLPVLCGQHHQPGEQGACVHCSRGHPVWPDPIIPHFHLFFFQTPLVSLSLSCVYSPAVSLCLSPLSHYSVLVLKPLYLSQWRCNSGIALATTKRNDILREFQKEVSASEGIWALLSKLPLTSMCRPWVQFPAPWENPKPRIKVRSQNCILHFEVREDTLFKVQILESHPFWINIGIE